MNALSKAALVASGVFFGAIDHAILAALRGAR
jgi:hypothetical protein